MTYFRRGVSYKRKLRGTVLSQYLTILAQYSFSYFLSIIKNYTNLF